MGPGGEGPPPALTRSERVAVHALDAPDTCLFRNVTPGGTFKVRFTLQNVDTTASGRTVDLSWGAPTGRSARLFLLDFPLPVKLRPGNSHSIEVTFKAGARYREEAFLDFTTQDGRFRVPLLTMEAQLTLEVRVRCGAGVAVAWRSAATRKTKVDRHPPRLRRRLLSFPSPPWRWRTTSRGSSRCATRARRPCASAGLCAPLLRLTRSRAISSQARRCS